MNDRRALIRLCKTSLVATVALFFAVIAFTNITDYATNEAFVRHVLSMDTILPGSILKWRAITAPGLQTAAYWLIIAWQIATAALLIAAAARLAWGTRAPHHFADAKGMAALGLTAGLLLYGLGFIVVGGEWFAMWQSPTWNGLPSAQRFFLLDGIVLLVLLTPEG